MDRAQPVGTMTLEQYLTFEERSPLKHEYVAGEVYTMTGASTRHNIITLNIVSHLRGPARKRGCQVFATDVKLHSVDRVYYPDIIVACGKAANVEYIVEAPSLVVEVTSPSTRATDRREKLDTYRRIPSLRLYLIVDQRRRHVFAYRRTADDVWERAEFHGDGEIPIPFLDTALPLDVVYEDVTLPPISVREEEEWMDYEEV